MKTDKSFKHESLQDQKSIADMLSAITEGIAKGKILLEDEDGQMILEPGGLMHLKVSASQEEERNRLNLRITWKGEEKLPKKKKLKVSSK